MPRRSAAPPTTVAAHAHQDDRRTMVPNAVYAGLPLALTLLGSPACNSRAAKPEQIAAARTVGSATAPARLETTTKAVAFGSRLPTRPVHTYSIVARDPASGELGVAVQSHWFAVGPIVAWAEPGVGAIATQAFVEPAYGKRGLELMRNGKSAPIALKAMLNADANREVRQVALIDAAGQVDAFTGKNAISAAGHAVGKDYAVQANLMQNEKVWPSMAQAFETQGGDLAERMLAALDAAEKSGGDLRGQQSAALIVVAGKATGQSTVARKFDVRVDDHINPLKELRRLVTRQRAYNHMSEGDLAAEQKNYDKARAEYRSAEKLWPKNAEITYWHAVALVNMGRVDDAIPLLKRVYAAENSFRTLTPRLAKAGLIPNDERLIARLTKL